VTVEPRRRGRPPATSRDEIAAAALRLAGDEGIEAVTIRRLATELGVAPMTLYSHAQTKDEILDLMRAAALESFEFVLDPDAEWPAQLHAGFMALYTMMRVHPVVIDLITGSQAMIGPEVDHVREALLGAMAAAGLPRQRAVDVFNTLGAYVVGVVTLEAARAARRGAGRPHQVAAAQRVPSADQRTHDLGARDPRRHDRAWAALPDLRPVHRSR
jgi:AcrR family transcriptional regulator